MLLTVISLTACGGELTSTSPPSTPSPTTAEGSLTGTWSSQPPGYGLVFGTIPGGGSVSPEESSKDPWATFGSVYDGDIDLKLVQTRNKIDGVVRLYNIRARPQGGVQAIQEALRGLEKQIHEFEEELPVAKQALEEAEHAGAEAAFIPELIATLQESVTWLQQQIPRSQEAYNTLLAALERLQQRSPPFGSFEWPIQGGTVKTVRATSADGSSVKVAHFSFEAGSWKWEGQLTSEGLEMSGTVKYSGTPGGMPSDSKGEFWLKLKVTGYIKGVVKGELPEDAWIWIPGHKDFGWGSGMKIVPIAPAFGTDLQENAKVTISGPVSLETEADEEGRFVFSDLPLGSYQVTASHPWYLSQTQTVELRSSESMEVSFVLVRGRGTIKGRVLRGGGGFSRVTVRVLNRYTAAYVSALNPEPDGSYSIRVPAGVYFVEVKTIDLDPSLELLTNAYNKATHAFLVEPDATVTHDIILEK